MSKHGPVAMCPRVPGALLLPAGTGAAVLLLMVLLLEGDWWHWCAWAPAACADYSMAPPSEASTISCLVTVVKNMNAISMAARARYPCRSLTRPFFIVPTSTHQISASFE